MAKQTIGLGTIANDDTGDTPRVAGDKINDNFDELYAAIPLSGPAPTYIRYFTSEENSDVQFITFYDISNWVSGDPSPVNYVNHLALHGFVSTDPDNLASLYTQYETQYTQELFANRATEWHLVSYGPGNASVNRCLSAYMPYDATLRGQSSFNFTFDSITLATWLNSPRVQFDLYANIQYMTGMKIQFDTNNVAVATQRNAANDAQWNLPFYTAFDNLQATSYCRLGPNVEGGVFYSFVAQGTTTNGDKCAEFTSGTLSSGGSYQWLGYFAGSTNGSSLFECYNSNATAGCRAIFVATCNSTSGDAYSLYKDSAGTGFGCGYNGGSTRFEINSAADILGVAPYLTITHAAGVPADSLFTIFGKLNTPTATPASASATGVVGTWAWDASFVYVCTATDTWKRVAIATW